jgi:hypothetical protein
MRTKVVLMWALSLTLVAVPAVAVHEQSMSLEGLAAARIRLHLNQETLIRAGGDFVRYAGDGDSANFLGLSTAWGSGAGYTIGSGSSVLGEVAIAAEGTGVDVSPARVIEPIISAPFGDDWFDSCVCPPGDVTIYIMDASSIPTLRSVFTLSTDPEVPAEWSFTRNVTFTTVRDLDQGASLMARERGLGVSVAQGSRTIHVEGGLFGFLRYRPVEAGVDIHNLTFHGPGYDSHTDHQVIMGGGPGDYTLEFQQVSAGDFPGSIYMLMADFPP